MVMPVMLFCCLKSTITNRQYQFVIATGQMSDKQHDKTDAICTIPCDTIDMDSGETSTHGCPMRFRWFKTDVPFHKHGKTLGQ